jgi:UDP-glucose 4-epimerase
MSLAFYTYGQQKGHLIVVIGLGLIGDAVSDQLSFFCTKIQSTNLSGIEKKWQKPSLFSDEINNIIGQLNPFIVEIVWCAGVAGFSATEEDMIAETDFYQQLLRSIAFPKKCLKKLNLLSSAGGIYEGTKGIVSSPNQIKPLRPYGLHKLKQENLNPTEFNVKRVFRPSTVYGIKKQNNGRKGLINRLIESTITGDHVRIYSSQNTLRDYVLNTDVAKFIANKILYDDRSDEYIIASGRPLSVSNLINLVNKSQKSKVKASYSLLHSNNTDIIFDPSILATPKNLTPVEIGIPLIAQLTKSRLHNNEVELS